MNKSKKKYLMMLLIVFFIVVFARYLRVTIKDRKTNVGVEQTKPSVSDNTGVNSVSDNATETTVVFVFDDKSVYSKKLDMYDSFLSSLFTDSPYTVNVSDSILEDLNSQIRGVSSLVPYISRQVEITHSGLSYTDDEIDYLAVCNVYCLDENSETIEFTSVVNFVFDSNDTLVNALIKAYR